MHDTVANRGNI
jgi:kinesin family protein 6/9